MRTPCRFCTNNLNADSSLAECRAITPADLPEGRIICPSAYYADGYKVRGDGLKDCPAFSFSQSAWTDYWVNYLNGVFHCMTMAVVFVCACVMLGLLIGGVL